MDFIRHQWVALLFVLALVLFAWDSHTQNSNNEKSSVTRSEDTCRRSNVSRAFFRIEAQDNLTFDKTASDAPLFFAILNCKRTVAAGGAPVPLPTPVQAEYLAIIRKRQVPITRDTKIIRTIPFADYFSPDENIGRP